MNEKEFYSEHRKLLIREIREKISGEPLHWELIGDVRTEVESWETLAYTLHVIEGHETRCSHLEEMIR